MKPKSKRIFRTCFGTLAMLQLLVSVSIANGEPKIVEDIVIKFKDTAFDIKTGKLKREVEAAITGNEGITPKAKLRPMIGEQQLKKFEVARTNGGFAKNIKRASVRVRNYYALEGEFNDHRTNVAALLIQKVPEIDTAYPAPAVNSPSTHVDPPADPGGTLYPVQYHLHDAPRGVGAISAWKLTPAGACGINTSLIDLEGGWSLDHKSIYGHRVGRIGTKNSDRDNWHGNSVLATICARDDQPKGVLGVAPHVSSVKVISHAGKSSLIASAIATAAEALPVGGVLVIEVQLQPFKGSTYQPAEVEDYIYAAIFDAVDKKRIVVIEAAGNGNTSLDTIATLNRCTGTSPFRDSLAIMVAGGSINSAGNWDRWGQSNYGSRIDNFAEAERAPTAWYPDNNTYWEKFNGTSLATAIIAGVALSTQGMYGQKVGSLLDGVTLRTVLATNIATPSLVAPPMACPSAGQWIGVMPDLVEIQKTVK